MFQMLKYIIIGHCHKWKVIATDRYEEVDRYDATTTYHSTVRTLQCEKCGVLSYSDSSDG